MNHAEALALKTGDFVYKTTMLIQNNEVFISIIEDKISKQCFGECRKCKRYAPGTKIHTATSDRVMITPCQSTIYSTSKEEAYRSAEMKIINRTSIIEGEIKNYECYIKSKKKTTRFLDMKLEYIRKKINEFESE